VPLRRIDHLLAPMSELMCAVTMRRFPVDHSAAIASKSRYDVRRMTSKMTAVAACGSCSDQVTSSNKARSGVDQGRKGGGS